MEATIFTTLILPLSLAVIMLGMGLSLTPNDFKRIFIQPKAVLIGACGQVFLLPFAGYLIATGFQLEPVHAVGVMILVACAGGATSNLIVYLAKGDVALSVSLTAISSCITVITIPLVVNFALFNFMSAEEQAALPIGITNLKLFLLTLLPVFLGMWIKSKKEQAAATWEKRISHFASIFFVALVTFLVVQNFEIIKSSFHTIGPAAFCLNAGTMLCGYLAAKLASLSVKQRLAISIEVGVQNGATGIFIAASLLQNTEMALFPALYSLIMYGNVIILITLINKLSNRQNIKVNG